MHGLSAFTLSDVALILDMDETRVKNWTIGRPIEVKPSVRTGSGPGSRNLYGIEDVYLLALADQLCRSGFTTRIAARAVELVKPKVGSLGKLHSALVIRASSGGEPEIILVQTRTGKVPRSNERTGCYALALGPLIERIQRGVHELPARIAARKRSKAKEEETDGSL